MHTTPQARIDELTALPRNPMNKIVRTTLQDAIGDLFTGQGLINGFFGQVYPEPKPRWTKPGSAQASSS